MDIERIESLLRAGPPAEPRYRPVLALGAMPFASQTPLEPVLGWRARPRRGRASMAEMSMVIALVVAVVGAGLWIRSTLQGPSIGPPPSPSPSLVSPSPPLRAVAGADLDAMTRAWATEVDAALGVAVVVDGRIFISGTVHTVAVTRLGPVSRIYVAAVVLQLVDEGLLSLDDPLARFVPGWPKGESITIRMLLSGSSGVASFSEPLDALEQRVAADPSHPGSVDDSLAIARARSPRFEPGTRPSPADTEDALLASVIESISGSGAAEIRRRFLDQIDLRSTFLAGDPVPAAGSTPTGEYLISGAEMLRGYRADPTTGVFGPIDDLDPRVLAVLGLARGTGATAGDLARFADAIHRRPDLLSDSSRELLGLPLARGGAGGVEACPCTDDVKRAVVTSGSLGAYGAMLAWFPDDGTTIAILTDRVVAPAKLQALLERIDTLIPVQPSP